jgi:hypothetical protein
MGIRQFQRQEGCDVTAGSAVMVYGEELAAALMAMLVVIDMLEMDDWASTRAKRRGRTRSFMVVDGMILGALNRERTQHCLNLGG